MVSKQSSRPWQPWRQRRPAWPLSWPPTCPRSLKRTAFYTISLLLLTGVHGGRYYNEPQLTVGSRAPETLVAPFGAEVPDLRATEAERLRLREEATQVYQVDYRANLTMMLAVERLLSQVDQARSLVVLPYVETTVLSTPTQRHVQRLGADRWQQLQAAVAEEGLSGESGLVESTQVESTQVETSELSPVDLAVTDFTAGDRQAVRELRRRFGADPEAYTELLGAIATAQTNYRMAIANLSDTDLAAEALSWSQTDWEAVQEQLPRALRRLQAIGITPGLPSVVRQNGIAAQLEDDLPPAVRQTASRWLENLIQPNLQVDRQLTRAQAERQLEQLPPVTMPVSTGEVIVTAGEQINEGTFAVLDYYQLTRRQINWWGLLQISGLMAGTITIFVLSQRLIKPGLRDRDRLLVLILACTVAPVASGLGVAYASLPAVALLVSSYYGPRLGLLVVGGVTCLLPLVTPVTTLTLAPLVLGSLVACSAAAHLRCREELAVLGTMAALTQAGTYGLLSVAAGQGLDLLVMVSTGGAGLFWSIAALGASPMLELLFDLVTPIRLAELANPNRPLLRRLATEAPGTFQHTLFVATLAERAAQKLNLNAELVRTGTLYHDIGKMGRPQYFIENQMGGPNPHVSLDDPYRSAAIIRDHVTDGLKMAKQYRLPTAIRAFIPEHQGTIRIAYFYHQAQLRQPDQVPDDRQFRYDGPIPQTPETGIVMLADACEAALRSLWSAPSSGDASDQSQGISEEDARRTVMRIFQSRWQDGQLAEAKLSREHLEQVADVFVEVWRQYYHERIRYPAPLLGVGK